MFQLYKKIYDDFIDDDHDQSVSITALTVQVNRLVSFFFREKYLENSYWMDEYD